MAEHQADEKRKVDKKPGRCFWIAPETVERRYVKNLGWLVAQIGRKIVFKVYVTAREHDADLLVVFESGVKFYSTFASKTVLHGWLTARRGLKGVPCQWNGQEVGDCDKLPPALIGGKNPPSVVLRTKGRR